MGSKEQITMLKAILITIMLASAVMAQDSFRSHDRNPSQVGKLGEAKRGLVRTPKLPAIVNEITNCDLPRSSRGNEPQWVLDQQAVEIADCLAQKQPKLFIQPKHKSKVRHRLVSIVTFPLKLTWWLIDNDSKARY